MTEPLDASTQSDRPQLRVLPDQAAEERPRTRPVVADGEVPIGTSDDVSVPTREPTRGTCTRARARAVVGWATTLVTDGERWRRLTHRVWGRPSADATGVEGGLFRPPDVWSTDRPCLRKQLHYARYGVQHPSGGPLRALSVMYAYAGVAVQACLYYLAWISERPARLIAAYALFAVLVQIPAVRDVLVVAATVLTAPFTWLV